jgi:hypothetical protein
MLALVAIPSGCSSGEAARAHAVLPWLGKSFFAEAGRARGTGISTACSRRIRWFKFRHLHRAVAAGDFGAFPARLRNPRNPFSSRAIKDEVRELSPGSSRGRVLQDQEARDPDVYFGLEKTRERSDRRGLVRCWNGRGASRVLGPLLIMDRRRRVPGPAPASR